MSDYLWLASIMLRLVARLHADHFFPWLATRDVQLEKVSAGAHQAAHTLTARRKTASLLYLSCKVLSVTSTA